MFAYFWQNVMSIGDRGAIKSPTVNVFVFICVILDSICFMKLNVPICLIHIFKRMDCFLDKYEMNIISVWLRCENSNISCFQVQFAQNILFALNLHLSCLKCLSLRYQVWMFINLICIFNWWIWIVITQVLLKIHIYFCHFVGFLVFSDFWFLLCLTTFLALVIFFLYLIGWVWLSLQTKDSFSVYIHLPW